MITPEKRKHPAKSTSKDEPPAKKPLGKKTNTNNAAGSGGGGSTNKFKGDGKRGGFKGKNNKFGGKKPQFNGKANSSAAPNAGEKQDWNKFKKEKKDLKLKRKSTRDTYEITQEVKKIYEQVKW